ncbi:uncharacterized protein LOC111007754 [Momordica charantia]|uniref:Uncharacterized protein LOC111007754 n=1 Tax=Momordica charantia TaxID=3673 RepID=A0A6J1C225_MOMCH|nr:uncharacterized protein LOC111007754 [Momordica charantia]
MQQIWACSKFSHLIPILGGGVSSAMLDFIRGWKVLIPWADLELLLVMLWSIWCARNRSISVSHAGGLLEGIRAWSDNYLSIYKQAQGVSLHEVDQPRQLWAGGWNPPLNPFLKVNVDAAVSKEEGAGVGVILRDSYGVVYLAAVWPLSFIPSVDWAECFAVFDGLRLGVEAGLDDSESRQYRCSYACSPGRIFSWISSLVGGSASGAFWSVGGGPRVLFSLYLISVLPLRCFVL